MKTYIIITLTAALLVAISNAQPSGSAYTVQPNGQWGPAAEGAKDTNDAAAFGRAMVLPADETNSVTETWHTNSVTYPYMPTEATFDAVYRPPVYNVTVTTSSNYMALIHWQGKRIPVVLESKVISVKEVMVPGYSGLLAK